MALSVCSAAIAWCDPRPARTGLGDLRRLWEDTTIYNGDSVITPDIFVIAVARLSICPAVNSIDQALAVVRGEFDGLAEKRRHRADQHSTITRAVAWVQRRQTPPGWPRSRRRRPRRWVSSCWRPIPTPGASIVPYSSPPFATRSQMERHQPMPCGTAFPISHRGEIAHELGVPIEATDDDPNGRLALAICRISPAAGPHLLYSRGLAPLHRVVVGPLAVRLLGQATPQDVSSLMSCTITRRRSDRTCRLRGATSRHISNWPLALADRIAALSEIAPEHLRSPLLDLPCHPKVAGSRAVDAISTNAAATRIAARIAAASGCECDAGRLSLRFHFESAAGCAVQ